MTLPNSGPISLFAVRAEIGSSGAIGLGDGNVRTLAGVASGSISISSCYGKTGAGGGGGGSGPFSATETDGASSGIANGHTSFTATVHPFVTASGGLAPYSYQWSIIIQDDAGFSLSNSTSSACSVSHTIGRFGYVGECTVQCVVGDSTGHSVTVNAIASFDYESDV